MLSNFPCSPSWSIKCFFRVSKRFVWVHYQKENQNNKKDHTKLQRQQSKTHSSSLRISLHQRGIVSRVLTLQVLHATWRNHIRQRPPVVWEETVF